MTDSNRLALIEEVYKADPFKEDVKFPDYSGKDLCPWVYVKAEGAAVVAPMIKSRPKILDSVLEAIGQTPMVRVSRMAAHRQMKCEVLAKCEYFNAGGSTKDRIALRMVEDMERSGKLRKGDTLIAATSGNTGVGLCMVAAVKGYQSLITLPQKMSGEKLNMMKALGATILRTPTEAAWNDKNSHIALAIRLEQKLDRAFVVDQYLDAGNPLAHYEGTGAEIVDQCGEKKPDMVVVAAGTGGTLTGIARRVKEHCPDCIVVGVDPKGSLLARPESLNKENCSYQIEGIGYDFVPSVLDHSLVDFWVKTEDNESFHAARDLIRYEGLLVGGSSGSNWMGVEKAIEKMGWKNDSTKRIVFICPDSSRNYMSKFIDDDWMIKNNFHL